MDKEQIKKEIKILRDNIDEFEEALEATDQDKDAWRKAAFTWGAVMGQLARIRQGITVHIVDLAKQNP